jgi:ribose/xylose/arabinose/galactoside ABC-type transport system permease subunit
MPWNQIIIPQPSTTTTTSSTISSTSGSTLPSSHSGLSTGAKAAVGVVIPLVVLAALAALFWLWRKRKATRIQNELDGSAAPAGEMKGIPVPKELSGADSKKELDARYTPQHELVGGFNSLPPVELG